MARSVEPVAHPARRTAGRFKRWLYFNDAYQMAQAALTGQGIALARMPLVADSLASGDLVEPLSNLRIDLPLAYWLIVSPGTSARPEVAAFYDWLKVQAQLTHESIGDVRGADSMDKLELKRLYSQTRRVTQLTRRCLEADFTIL
jgi:DNA-binding transcriptional LysR family regulator